MEKKPFWKVFEKNKPVVKEVDNYINTTQFKRDTSSIGNAKELARIINLGVKKGNYEEINSIINDLDFVRSGSDVRYTFDIIQSNINQKRIVQFGASSIVFFVFLCIGLFVIAFSNEFRNTGLIIAVVSFVIIYLDVCGILSAIKKIKFEKRYQILKQLLKYHKFELVDDLAEYSGIETKQVISDLNKAINLKLIPQGHFGKNNKLFITNDESYLKYLEMPAAFDRYYRKLSEERARMRTMPNELKEMLEKGQFFIDEIKETNQLIKDKQVTEKLNMMESIVTDIFHEVDVNPQHADKLGMMLNYYLPTTEKLLDEYVDMIENGRSKRNRVARYEIEKTLDVINIAFGKILDKFYEEQEMDITSEIVALNTMLEMDGLKE